MTATPTLRGPNLATRLRSRSLQVATALFAGLFAVGAVFGLPQLLDGSDPPAFLMPVFVCAMCTGAWFQARLGRERLARTLFVLTCFLYLSVTMIFAPFQVVAGLGFALAMLTVFLFHLVHPAKQAAPISLGIVAVMAVGYAVQAAEDLQSVLQWPVLSSMAAQLLVLGFSSFVLGRLGQGWGDALDEADQARTQLLEAHRLALQANRAKSRFLASMSHELRTPLNAVIGYSELVQEELQSGGTPEIRDVERIQTAGHHLLGLVDQVLDLSRIEAGKLKLEPTGVSLDALVREVCDTLRPEVRQRRNQLVLDVQPVAQASLDPLRTRQIVTNLIGNAAKFTHHGTITVRVMQDAEQLRVEVCDDGPGIPRHRLDDIFAPFEQASDDVQGRYGGTGLGLAISRRLTREMGGDLWADSTLGEGATFFLVLPVGGMQLGR